MRKLSKILALSMVSVMLFGMTAFAADSPKLGDVTASLEDPKSLVPEGSKLEVQEVDFKTAVSEEEQATLSSELEAFAKSYEGGSGETTYEVTTTQLQTLEITPEAGYAAITEEGLVLNNAFEFKSGVMYFAYHLHNGIWTRHTISAYGAGQMILWGVTDFSTFVFYEMTFVPVGGDPGPDPDPGTPNTPANNEENNAGVTPTSPQTGETMPIAVVIGLIALAGAVAVSTRKVIDRR